MWFENGGTKNNVENVDDVLKDEPKVEFEECFDKNTWWTDVLVVFHNGIRLQVKELLTLLKRGIQDTEVLRRNDIKLLTTLMIHLRQSSCMYFLIQQRILYPYMLRKSVDKVWIEPVRKQHITLTNMILEMNDKIRVLNDDNDMSHVFKLTCEYYWRLQDFFKWELKGVGYIIREEMGQCQAQEMLNRCIHEMLQHTVGEDVFGAFSYWMPNKLRNQYLQTNRHGIDLLPFQFLSFNRIKRKEMKWNKTHHTIKNH